MGDDRTVGAGAFERGRALLAANRVVEAVAVVGAALATDPSNHLLTCLLAAAEHRAGHLADALQLANRAIGLAPDEEWGHRIASVTLGALGQHAMAVVAAQEAVRCAPLQVEPHARLGFALFFADRLDEASAEAAWLLAQGPNRDTYRLAALIAIGQDRLFDAEAALRRGLHAFPDDAQLVHLLGDVEWRKGDREAAGLHFLAAQRLDPTGTSARTKLVSTLAERPGAGGGWLVLVAVVALGLVLAWTPAVRLGVLGAGAAAALVGFAAGWRRDRAAPDVAQARAIARKVDPAVRARRQRLVGVTGALVLAMALAWLGWGVRGSAGSTHGGRNATFVVTGLLTAWWAGANGIRRLRVAAAARRPRVISSALPKPAEGARPPRYQLVAPPPQDRFRDQLRVALSILVLVVGSIVAVIQLGAGGGSTRVPDRCRAEAERQRTSIEQANVAWHVAAVGSSVPARDAGVGPTEAQLAAQVGRTGQWSLYDLDAEGSPVLVADPTC